MPFRRDMPRTINHPDILAFIAVCDKLKDGNILSEQDLRSVEILAMIDSIFILKWDENEGDFQYRYWGTSVANAYGLDLTGKHLRKGHPHAFTEKFIEAHYEAMTQKKRVFLGGSLDWRQKDHRTWDQVTMPLARGDKVDETLSYIRFNI